MSDVSLATAIETTRGRLLELEAQLARRRATEAAELELIESQRGQLARRTGQLERERVEVVRAIAQLSQAQQELTRGLSAARRSWLRLGEPVLGAILVFVMPVSVALTHKRLPLILLEVGALSAGTAVARWRHRRRVAR